MNYYEFCCIHCRSTNVFAVTNDGGSVQMCNKCNQPYKGKKIGAIDTNNITIHPKRLQIPNYINYKNNVCKLYVQ